MDVIQIVLKEGGRGGDFVTKDWKTNAKEDVSIGSGMFRTLVSREKVYYPLEDQLAGSFVQTLQYGMGKVNKRQCIVFEYGCESWTVKKAERQRIDAFELWCWRRLLRVPWSARRSNQSILKEISPGCSLEGLMLKLKLQYFGHFMRRVDSLEKTLMLGGIGGRRRRG